MNHSSGLISITKSVFVIIFFPENWPSRFRQNLINLDQADR